MPIRRRAPAAISVLAWLAAGFCLAWALARTLGLEAGFPAVPIMAWTPFALPLAVAVAIAAVLVRHPAAAATAGLAALLLAVAVVPRAFGVGHEPAGADGPELRVLSANLGLGEADPETVVGLVEELEVDVLCLQELTPEIGAALRARGLDELLSHHVWEPAPRSVGTGISAKLPLRTIGSVAPPGYSMAMPLARLGPPQRPLAEVACVHPGPPTRRGVGEWKRGLNALPGPSSDRPPLLMPGDFNATLDHAELREVIGRGFVDAGEATGGGLAPTWPDRLLPPPVTIDHVLVDSRVAVLAYGVQALPGSDHSAVFAQLRLPG